MDYTYRYDSPLGGMTLACDGDALTGLWFDGQKFGKTLSSDREERFFPVFAETLRWLDLYFSGRVPNFTPRIHMRATPFQRVVWETLLTVPYGQTVTYGQIARFIAAKRSLPRMSAQAVGGAVGRNPICLIIPCHRVLGADGSLTGYAGGIDRKRALLLLEERGMNSF